MAKNLVNSLLPLTAILLIGTLGYMVIEKWSWFDSLYMTVITLTTVGYGETHPLSQAGKIFTVCLILVGIGNMAFIVRNLSIEILNPFMGVMLKQKKMEKLLKAYQNHYIICGYGRIGRDVVKTLFEAGKQVVVVDRKLAIETFEFGAKIPLIQGDASHEEVLLQAGIERAKGLVTCVNQEAENVFITLTARELNANLFIISRYEEDQTHRKLMRAGADRVINPYNIGGAKISQIILKPTINKILDRVQETGEMNLSFEELDLGEDHPWVGQLIQECNIRHEFNVIIVAVEKSNGNIKANPGPDYRFSVRDRIVVIADQSELSNLAARYA